MVSIDWQDKDLAGDINLNGFSAMQKVNLSRNKITVVDATNCSALTDMNVSRNKLSELDLTGCIALVKLDCYKKSSHGNRPFYISAIEKFKLF